MTYPDHHAEGNPGYQPGPTDLPVYLGAARGRRCSGPLLDLGKVTDITEAAAVNSANVMTYIVVDSGGWPTVNIDRTSNQSFRSPPLWQLPLLKRGKVARRYGPGTS